MKILFISMVAFENNTSATIRNKSLIKGLSELGHSIDTLTLRPDEVSISYDESMNDIKQLVTNSYYIDINSLYYRLMAKKGVSKSNIANNGKYNRNIIKTIINKSRNIIKNIYDKTTIFDAQKFNVRGVSKVKVDYSKYDVIISSSDPKSSHLIARKIYKENKNCKAKWIQYWGDPMYNDITRTSDWRDHLIKYCEKKLVSEANRIVYVSPITLDTQKDIFPKIASKMDYVSQSYAFVVDKVDEIKNPNMKADKKDLVSVGYFGAYKSSVRNIMPLYNSAKNNNFKLNICGFSDISLTNTDNIKVYDILSYQETVKMEAESDILVSICNLRGTQIPGKIYYVAGYMKPIIIILDGEYKDYLKEHFSKYDRYILCDNEENSIKDAIEKAKAQLKKNEYKIDKQLEPKYMAERILGEIKSGGNL